MIPRSRRTFLSFALLGSLALLSSSARGSMFDSDATGDQKAYISNTGNGTVSEIDITTGHKIVTIGGFASPGTPPFYVATRADAKSVYLASDTSIYRIASNGPVQPKIITLSAGGVVSMQMDRQGKHVLFLEQHTGTVGVINTASQMIKAHIPLTVTVHGSTFNMSPVSMVVDPNKQLAYIVDAANGLIGVLDVTRQVVTDVVGVTGSAPILIAISPDGELLYVKTSFGLDILSAITDTVIGENIFGYQNTAAGMVVSNDGKTLYVADVTTNSIDAIDTATLTVRASLALPSTPTDITLDQTGTHAVVTEPAANTLAVIDLVHGTIANITTGLGPRGGSQFIRNSSPACTGQIERIDVRPDTPATLVLPAFLGYRLVGPSVDRFDVIGFDCDGNAASIGQPSYSLKNGPNLTLTPVTGSPQFDLSASVPSRTIAALTVTVTDPTDGHVFARTLHIEASSALYLRSSAGTQTMMELFDTYGNQVPFPSTAFATSNGFSTMQYNPGDGFLYTTESGENQIQVWTLSGSLVKTIADPSLAEPWGIAFDPKNHDFYVANPDFELLQGKTPSVQVFNAAGQNVTPPGAFPHLSEPIAIRYAPKSDTFYVSDGREGVIQEFTSQGAFVRKHVVSTLMDFALDPVTQDIYVPDADQTSIDLLGSNLIQKKVFGSGIVNELAMIEFDPTLRKLYAIDCCFDHQFDPLGNEFTPNGQFIDPGINNTFRGLPQTSGPLAVVP